MMQNLKMTSNTSTTSSSSSSSSNSNHNNFSNLSDDHDDAIEEQPLDLQDLVYEEPDDVAVNEENTPPHESMNEIDVQGSSERFENENVEHIGEHAELNESNGEKNLEQEDGVFIPDAEIIEDESIVYATDDVIGEDNDQLSKSPATALTEERRMLASAADYQNADLLFNEQICNPEEYLEAGGLDDVDDPVRYSSDSVHISEDQIDAEELVIVNVDPKLEQQEEKLAEEELQEEDCVPLRASVAPTHDVSDHQVSQENYQQASELKLEKNSLENDVHKEHELELKTDVQEAITDPDMHPAIAQAIKTRNERFPLLDDPKLPHTRENFNLPPLVEGHSVPVEKGTYKDYVFDLERQEYLQKEEVTKAHTEYLEKHHELKQIVSDFLTSILIDKPSDVYRYAADYFSVAVN